MSIETVKGKCLQEILQHHVFLVSLCEMLLISACVLANNFLKKRDALDPQVLHTMTFKTSMKTSYLVATDAE